MLSRSGEMRAQRLQHALECGRNGSSTFMVTNISYKIPREIKRLDGQLKAARKVHNIKPKCKNAQ